MTHQVYALEPPERFVAGTVGPPGDRTFFLQARGGGMVAWPGRFGRPAHELEELLGEAGRRFGVDVADSVTDSVVATADNEPLDTPLDEEFRVGTLGLAFDVDTTTVVIEAIAAGEDDEDAEEELDDEQATADRDRLRVRLTPQATRAFIERARRVVASGRPPCPLCGQPLDPRGHLCPRHNGYRR
jgi:uncharacterized repeat protein (TIGR03847 family)